MVRKTRSKGKKALTPAASETTNPPTTDDNNNDENEEDDDDDEIGDLAASEVADLEDGSNSLEIPGIQQDESKLRENDDDTKKKSEEKLPPPSPAAIEQETTTSAAAPAPRRSRRQRASRSIAAAAAAAEAASNIGGAESLAAAPVVVVPEAGTDANSGSKSKKKAPVKKGSKKSAPIKAAPLKEGATNKERATLDKTDPLLKKEDNNMEDESTDSSIKQKGDLEVKVKNKTTPVSSSEKSLGSKKQKQETTPSKPKKSALAAPSEVKADSKKTSKVQQARRAKRDRQTMVGTDATETDTGSVDDISLRRSKRQRRSSFSEYSIESAQQQQDIHEEAEEEQIVPPSDQPEADTPAANGTAARRSKRRRRLSPGEDSVASSPQQVLHAEATAIAPSNSEREQVSTLQDDLAAAMMLSLKAPSSTVSGISGRELVLPPSFDQTEVAAILTAFPGQNLPRKTASAILKSRVADTYSSLTSLVSRSDRANSNSGSADVAAILTSFPESCSSEEHNSRVAVVKQVKSETSYDDDGFGFLPIASSGVREFSRGRPSSLPPKDPGLSAVDTKSGSFNPSLGQQNSQKEFPPTGNQSDKVPVLSEIPPSQLPLQRDNSAVTVVLETTATEKPVHRTKMLTFDGGNVGKKTMISIHQTAEDGVVKQSSVSANMASSALEGDRVGKAMATMSAADKSKVTDQLKDQKNVEGGGAKIAHRTTAVERNYSKANPNQRQLHNNNNNYEIKANPSPANADGTKSCKHSEGGRTTDLSGKSSKHGLEQPTDKPKIASSDDYKDESATPSASTAVTLGTFLPEVVPGETPETAQSTEVGTKAAPAVALVQTPPPAQETAAPRLATALKDAHPALQAKSLPTTVGVEAAPAAEGLHCAVTAAPAASPVHAPSSAQEGAAATPPSGLVGLVSTLASECRQIRESSSGAEVVNLTKSPGSAKAEKAVTSTKASLRVKETYNSDKAAKTLPGTPRSGCNQSKSTVPPEHVESRGRDSEILTRSETPLSKQSGKRSAEPLETNTENESKVSEKHISSEACSVIEVKTFSESKTSVIVLDDAEVGLKKSIQPHSEIGLTDPMPLGRSVAEVVEKSSSERSQAVSKARTPDAEAMVSKATTESVPARKNQGKRGQLGSSSHTSTTASGASTVSTAPKGFCEMDKAQISHVNIECLGGTSRGGDDQKTEFTRRVSISKLTKQAAVVQPIDSSSLSLKSDLKADLAGVWRSTDTEEVTVSDPAARQAAGSKKTEDVIQPENSALSSESVDTKQDGRQVVESENTVAPAVLVAVARNRIPSAALIDAETTKAGAYSAGKDAKTKHASAEGAEPNDVDGTEAEEKLALIEGATKTNPLQEIVVEVSGRPVASTNKRTEATSSEPRTAEAVNNAQFKTSIEADLVKEALGAIGRTLKQESAKTLKKEKGTGPFSVESRLISEEDPGKPDAAGDDPGKLDAVPTASSSDVVVSVIPHTDENIQDSQDARQEKEDRKRTMAKAMLGVDSSGNPISQRLDFEHVKLLLYTEGATIYEDIDEKFADYWDAIRMRFDGGNSLSNVETSRSEINRFLKTRKLRRLHNTLIKALLRRCLMSRVPLDEISGHIPQAWRKRIKICPRDAMSQSLPDQTLKLRRAIMSVTEKLGYLPTIGGASARPQKFKRPCNASLRLPGGLAIDPEVRALAQEASMEVSEHAVWAVVVSAKEYASVILQGCLAQKKAMHNDKLNRPKRPRSNPVIGRPEKKTKKDSSQVDIPMHERVISAVDIHGFTTSLPMGGVESQGGSVSRVACERTLMATAGNSLPPFGPVFHQLKRFMWEKIAPSSSTVITFQKDSPALKPEINETLESGSGDSGAGRKGHRASTLETSETQRPAHVGPTRAAKETPEETSESRDALKPALGAPEDNPAATLETSTKPKPFKGGLGRGSKDLSAKLVPGAAAGRGRGGKTLAALSGGLGRGGKDLAALKKRSSVKANGEPMTDMSERGSESSRHSSQYNTAQPTTKASESPIPQTSAASSNVGPSLQGEGEHFGLSRRGKGFGIKDLAALRARSSGPIDEITPPKIGGPMS